MKNAYIAGALTNNDRKKEFYEEIGKLISKYSYLAYIPHLFTDPTEHPDATPEEVYTKDMKQIENSNLLIAYIGSPSLGVGAEIAHARKCGIPVILLFEKNKITKSVSKSFFKKFSKSTTIIKFTSEEEALLLLAEELKPKVFIDGFNNNYLCVKLNELVEKYGYNVTAKVKDSKLVLSYVGNPSLEVGYNLEIANQLALPIILMYEKDARVSRLARGIPSVVKHVKYSSENEALALLSEELLAKYLKK